MDELRRLGIVARLANELSGITGVRDKTLAEYVYNLWKTDTAALASEVSEFGPDALSRISDLIQNLTRETEVAKPKIESSEPQKARPAIQFRNSGPQTAAKPRGPLRRDELKIGEAYDGVVTKTAKYGAFVHLVDVRPPTDGLIHVSQLAEHKVDNVEDIVQAGDHVMPRILKIDGHKIGLSLRTVVADAPKRVSSPERFEMQQMVAAGSERAPVLGGVDDDDDTADSHVDVEVRHEIPKFLSGTGLAASAFLSSSKPSDPDDAVSFFPKADGDLAQAAATSSQLAKERIEASKVNPGITRNWKQSLGPVGKVDKQPLSAQRKQLPVFDYREEILKTVAQNQVVIIVGETGSGKTTQIPQYLAESGYATMGKMVGCTQPRRVASVSIATRVAEEVGTFVGDKVGYTIRFEDKTSRNTKIKYMTDGMLEREVLTNTQLSNYNVIMLDEAHERTISTDILFALIKGILSKRPEFRLIVASATLEAQRFVSYFGAGTPVLNIPGRMYPVDVIYSPTPQPDYIEAALVLAMQVHMAEPDGDILVFLTGQEEIDTSCEILYERAKKLEGIIEKQMVVLPVYSALPDELQSRIFQPSPPGSRKVIFATNIAETSITIPGIRYVIDCGLVKMNIYDAQLGMDSLKTVPISRAQAQQRAGRAGRTAPGKCYRVYTEKAFEEEMLINTVPEIRRMNLANTMLMLKAIGIRDVLKFDFLDPPPKLGMLKALGELFQLGALDSEGSLTRVGRQMSEFPMEPAMARTLIQSAMNGCVHEMLTIIAMLSVPSVFYRPNAKQAEADRAKMRFNDGTGDHFTLLNVYDRWSRNKFSRSWCTDNYVQFRSMQHAKDVRNQLMKIMLKHRHKLSSSGDRALVLQALCAGYFRNTARRSGEAYKTLAEDTNVAIHPSSSLFGKRPEYLLYHTLILTSREYMHWVSVIQPGWLAASAPAYFKAVAPVDNKRRRTETLNPLHNRYAEHDDDWRISAQRKYVKYESTSFGR